MIFNQGHAKMHCIGADKNDVLIEVQIQQHLALRDRKLRQPLQDQQRLAEDLVAIHFKCRAQHI